jgi:hypothetical protein
VLRELLLFSKSLTDFFDPSPEEQNVVLIDSATLRKAEQMIESCERCNPYAFAWVLDRVTGSDYTVTDLHLGRAREVSEVLS